MKLRNYQTTLLESLRTNKFSLIKHSRQMGVSTVLVEFIVETLLEQNNTNNNTIILFTEKLASAKHLLNKIRLDGRISDLKKIKDTVSILQLENGNLIKIASTLDGLRALNSTHVIIDNACFINRLDDIISCIIPVLSSQFNSKLIIASSNKKGSSFFNNLFNDNENNFIKNKLHWSIDEENIKKYEEYKLIVDSETFKIEMDLEDSPEIKLNKDHLLSFRVNDELYVNLTKKLLILDLSLSEYLRTIINKDNDK